MADITMCSGGQCSMKKQCYRHTATPNEYRQSYFTTPPYSLNGKDDCSYFIRNERNILTIYHDPSKG